MRPRFMRSAALRDLLNHVALALPTGARRGKKAASASCNGQTLLSAIPDFFVPASMVVQQLQHTSSQTHTDPLTIDVEALRCPTSVWHRWVEWSPDGQLVRRRHRAPPPLSVNAPWSGMMEKTRDTPETRAAMHGAAPRDAYTLTTRRTGWPDDPTDFTPLHDALALLTAVVPTFPVPVEAVEAVLQSWWHTPPSTDATCCAHNPPVPTSAVATTALHRRFPTAAALLAHPQLAFALVFPTADACTASSRRVQLHPCFAHARRGRADVLYAGLGLPTRLGVVCRHGSAEAALSPPSHELLPVVELASVKALLERLSLTAPAPVWPLALWPGDGLHTLHLVAWEGQPGQGPLLHCVLRLTYTALRGPALSPADADPLRAASDRLVLIEPEDASRTELGSEAVSGTLCRCGLAALAELTGVPLGRLWHGATPLWQAARLAGVLGLRFTWGTEGHCTDDAARRHAAPALAWGAMAAAVATVLLQRDQAATAARRAPALPLAQRLAASPDARQQDGLNCRYVSLRLSLHRTGVAAGVACEAPLPCALDALCGLSGVERAALVHQLVALWGPEDAPASVSWPMAPPFPSPPPQQRAMAPAAVEAHPVAPPSVTTSDTGKVAASVGHNAADAAGPCPGTHSHPVAAAPNASPASPMSEAPTETIGADFLDEAMPALMEAPSSPQTSSSTLTPARRTVAVAALEPPRAEDTPPLPPSFIHEGDPLLSPPHGAFARPRPPPRTPMRRDRSPQPFNRPLHTRHKPREPSAPARRLNEWDRGEGTYTFSSVPQTSAGPSAAARDLALDILDAASSSTQRRLRPW